MLKNVISETACPIKLYFLFETIFTGILYFWLMLSLHVTTAWVLKLKSMLPLLQLLQPGSLYWRGQLSTVGLLVLTRSGQLLLILKTLFTFYRKSHLNDEDKCTGPSPLVRGPCSNHWQTPAYRTKPGPSFQLWKWQSMHLHSFGAK